MKYALLIPINFIFFAILYIKMNAIESILLENIDKNESLFIFPTSVAINRWIDRLLRLKGGGSIAIDKFMAWDKFKENSIRSRVQDKKSISNVLRKMFIISLIKKNEELCLKGEFPIFTSLIKPEWAGQAESFVSWISELLPQLGLWYRQTGLGSDITAAPPIIPAGDYSEDDIDLYNLAIKYKKFLEENNLFEPAWERPPFEDTGKKCYLFFTDSLKDFNEYREILEASLNVKIINPQNEAEIQNSDVFYYTNSRSEITEAVLYIKALNENKNIQWDSISVCIPEGELYDPYLIRELENRNIPYVKQKGSPLSSYQAGKFFSSLLACYMDNFSFTSLRDLLLNTQLPWKHEEEINNLIRFGINNNCICSWTEFDVTINVWEDAFNKSFGPVGNGTKQFFRDLKKNIETICNAPSFSEIRKQYFIFREYFFNMENVLEEANTILSRCISELISLTEIEKNFPAIKVPAPFSFFSSCLDDTIYLAQQDSMGISILPYNTAAPAPFDCHIILGSSQEALTAIFSPLSFLPKNKREKLSLFDTDASLTFVKLHKYNSLLPAAFFCSEQSFSGYAIPHYSLGLSEKPRQRYDIDSYNGKFAADLYMLEKENILNPQSMKEKLNLHSIQNAGFFNWKTRRKTVLSYSSSEEELDPVLELINKKYKGEDESIDKVYVSSSSLAPYFKCNLIWIFDRILNLENTEITTSLMARNISGMVYHSIINLFLNELKESNKDIDSSKITRLSTGGQKLPETYEKILKEKTEEVFNGFPMLSGSFYQVMSMLTSRLIQSQKEIFLFNLNQFFAVFLSFFSGYRVISTESDYIQDRDTYYLRGIVDCVLEDRRDPKLKNFPLLIADFKTSFSSTPKITEYTSPGGISDFQLPLYLRLIEGQYEREVHTALFFSIVDAEPRLLFGSIKDEKNGIKYPKKDDNIIAHNSVHYNSIMAEFDEKSSLFAAEIGEGVFPQYPEYKSHCISCDYSRVCRTLYKIGRDENV